MIKNTIGVDLEKALAAANEKETQLRAERLRLIKDKIKAAGGKDKDLNVANGKCNERVESAKRNFELL